MRNIPIFLFLIFTTFNSQSKEVSLAEIRNEILGKKIVIIGKSFSGGFDDYLADWYLVEKDIDENYRRSSAAFASNKGKEAEVVEVKLDSSKNKKDIFDKDLNDSMIINPRYLKFE